MTDKTNLWQPIATFPQDGRWFLALFLDRTGARVLRWDEIAQAVIEPQFYSGEDRILVHRDSLDSWFDLWCYLPSNDYPEALTND